MRTTSPLGKNREHTPRTLSFLCRSAVCALCLHRFRDHTKRGCARTSALWRKIFHVVCRRRYCWRLVSLDTKTLSHRVIESLNLEFTIYEFRFLIKKSLKS